MQFGADLIVARQLARADVLFQLQKEQVSHELFLDVVRVRRVELDRELKSVGWPDFDLLFDRFAVI